MVKAFMAITEDGPAVGKADARSDYTNLDLHYVEDQRKNLLSKFNSLKQELSLCKSKFSDLKNTKVENISLQHEVSRLNLDNESLRDKVSDLKKVIEKWTSSKVILDQLLIEQVLGNIVHALGGREPLPPLLKLLGAEPISISNDESSVKAIKKKAQTKTTYIPDPSPDKKADTSTKQLLLTLMEEVKGLKKQIKPSSDNYASVSQTGNSK
nr:hypothetical protein [Tanacetum cinerariifolium]